MASDLWDAQLARLLRGHRDPAVDPARLERIGRELADLLREDRVLESNLETLLPTYQDPEPDVERLDEIGRALAGKLAVPRPSRRVRARKPGSPSGAWTWAAATAAAAVLLVAVALAGRAPGRAPLRPPEPVVVLPPAPPSPEPVVPHLVPPPPPPGPEPVRDPIAAPAPKTPAPPPAAAPPAPAPPAATAQRTTMVAPPAPDVALLELSAGSVDAPGRRLKAGDKVATGADGRAVVAFPDGSTLELGANAELAVAPWIGRSAQLARGTATVHAAPQAAGRSFVVGTPQADAKVLGTRFTLTVAGESTRLEVREGKVRFARTSDGASVDVAAGHFAVAASGVALLTRPLPEEPKTAYYEVEEFGTARGTKPADGLVRRPFLEPFEAAQGGWCVAVPGAGMEIAGDLRLAKGTWQLWVRHRDEPGAAKIGFDVLVNGQLAGQAATPGRGRDWHWKRFTINWPGGTARVTLRSTFEGVKASPTMADYRQSPYGALNRWDRLCLSPDASFTPD